MKTFYFLLLSIFILFYFTSCSVKNASFANSFKVLTLKDTLIFAVEMGEGTSASLTTTDTIALEVFNKNVPATLRTEIEHILDGGDPVIQRLGRLALDAQYDALAIDIQAFWFRNQSLLIYDKKAKQVTGLFPVAEFYGGDGGQILKQSWLLSSNNILKELIVRTSQHTLKIDENAEEPSDIYDESVARYIWQKNKFVAQTITDSTALIQAFPIEWGF